MSYLNRQGAQVGYTCSVYLSAAVRIYPGTLLNEAFLDSPVFEGYGIRVALSVTAVVIATSTIGYKDPEWIITKTPEDTEITRIAGWECNLNISVYDNNGAEYIDISFDYADGKPVWAGLPDSNLPQTRLTETYNINTYTGSVNGYTYSGNIPHNAVEISVGQAQGQSEYGSGTFTDIGDFAATVQYSAGSNSLLDYTYTATGSVAGYDGYLTFTASGTSITAEGEHLSRCLLRSGARIRAEINEYPAAYKYNIKERNGINISNLEFEDINGDTWQGDNSGWIEYAGRQRVTAAGEFNTNTHTETASPAFTGAGYWDISDPAPLSVGGISCTNPERATDYSITITDPESERETTYKPSRVMIYAPLGPGGNLEGSLAVTVYNSISLDTFSEGWTVSNGVLAGHNLSIDVGGGSISKSGYIRPKYSGEHGDLSAAELIPHLPLNNILILAGSGFDPLQSYGLKMTAKERTYNYTSVEVTMSRIAWDLTRPDGFRGSDEQAEYSVTHKPEQYTGSNSQEADKYYIDEEACRFELYGPALYQSLEISGFTAGTYTINNITAVPADNNIYYNFAPEFKQVQEYGRQDIGGYYHPIERNRQGVIAAGGRFVEIPNNQKDTTPSGVVTWHFPRVAALETPGAGAIGDRLLFPRDDTGNIAIAAGQRAAGTNPPPASDLISQEAYIGWVVTDGSGAAPKIKPFADIIQYNYFYINSFNELEAVIDLSGAWQGLTGSGARIDYNGTQASSEVQYMVKGIISPTTLRYIRSGEIKREKVTETPPGFTCRYAMRLLKIHGKILRNAAGKILRNAAGIILRGDFEI